MSFKAYKFQCSERYLSCVAVASKPAPVQAIQQYLGSLQAYQRSSPGPILEVEATYSVPHLTDQHFQQQVIFVCPS